MGPQGLRSCLHPAGLEQHEPTDWLALQLLEIKTYKYTNSTCIFPHLYKIFLAAIHNILWGQAVDHVAGVKYYQEKNHTKEEKSLRTGSLRPYFVQLKRRFNVQLKVCKGLHGKIKTECLLTLIQKNQMPMLRMPAIDVSTKYIVMTVIRM